MRNLQKTLAFVGLLVTSSIGQLIGCSNDAANCELNYETCTTSSGSSSGVGPLPGCTDLPSKNAEVIRTECAYFVGGAKKSDSNTGGETDPFATLGAALNAAKAQKARVYLCGSVAERVDIPANVSVFGGFDCSADKWKYDATMRGSIAPTAPAKDAAFQSSVRITGSGTISIEDVNIEAAAATISGGSSIAVIVDTTTVHFARANFTAGNGKDGAPGQSLPDDMTLAGVSGNVGLGICAAGATSPGGAEVMKMCADGTTSIGAKGGDGGLIDVVNMNKELAGGNGADGTPALGAGAKGLGEPETGMWSCASNGNAQSGEQGSQGAKGNGAQGNGEINVTGYVPVNGAGASDGTPGQGGGGGGGAKGKANICNNAAHAGASGGSGGSGGCGGKGGGGGQGGGASMALLSLNATIVLTECALTTATGGKGGDGGTGQTGGTGAGGAKGGVKSSPSNGGCTGGTGGDGGAGGPGGGGTGGPAVGIAYVGSAPKVDASSSIIKGVAGKGGAGGENNVANNPGSNGASDTTLKF